MTSNYTTCTTKRSGTKTIATLNSSAPSPPPRRRSARRKQHHPYERAGACDRVHAARKPLLRSSRLARHIPASTRRGQRPVTALLATHDMFRRWLHLPDTGALDAVLGAVAANRIEGDPVWLLLVGPPGGGKSEILNAISDLEDAHPAGTLTEAITPLRHPETRPRRHTPKAAYSATSATSGSSSPKTSAPSSP